MNSIRFGGQTYAWYMSYDRYVGKIGHILDICKKGGLTGLEVETVMLRDYFEDGPALKALFDERGMLLAALAVPIGWGVVPRHEIDVIVDKSIALGDTFPGLLLSLGILPPSEPFMNVAQEQKLFLEYVTQISKKACEKGLKVSFHTNSSKASLFRTEAEYDVLYEWLCKSDIGFTPDAGHIARGDMDVLKIFQRFAPYIRHVHFKDMTSSREWAQMGEGCIDFKGIVRILRQAGYDGWIVVEEESSEALSNPDDSMLVDAAFMRTLA